jgi:hypothetical protein
MTRRLVRLLWLVPVVLAIGSAGCDDNPNEPADREAPAVPRGLTSITGDEEVELRWFANEEWDLQGYRVYRSDQATGYYDRIGWVTAHSPGSVYEEVFVDHGLQNGDTWYYAVSAVDYSGNESELSWEEVFDTPRPEGRGVSLRNYYEHEVGCAYDFSRYRATDYDDWLADIAYAYEDGVAWMWGLEGEEDGYITELQDAGFAEMDGISWAPPDGWSQWAAVELIVGHVYVVWTRDDHYAKFRVRELTPHEVVFDWAYQVARGNQELREQVGGGSNRTESSLRRQAPILRRSPQP